MANGKSRQHVEHGLLQLLCHQPGALRICVFVVLFFVFCFLFCFLLLCFCVLCFCFCVFWLGFGFGFGFGFDFGAGKQSSQVEWWHSGVCVHVWCVHGSGSANEKHAQ